MKNLLHHFRTGDPSPVEALLASISLTFGIWLLLPPDTFATAHAYRFMASLPEGAWGVVFTAEGMMRLVALEREDLWLRRIASLAGAQFWVLTAAMFAFGDWRALGGPIMTIYAVASAWCAARDGAIREAEIKKGRLLSEQARRAAELAQDTPGVCPESFLDGCGGEAPPPAGDGQ